MSDVAASVVNCPRDGASLVEVERSGVLIDACPSCRGIWLDRGKLETLLARERAAAPDEDFLREVTGKQRSPGDAAENDWPGQSDHRRKRGGVLQSFLDFGGE